MIILKKIMAGLLGGTVLLAGLAMIVMPGPAVVVIPAALAILAVEFMWARRWLDWLRARYKAVASTRTASIPKSPAVGAPRAALPIANAPSGGPPA